ncbi:Thiol:disulfide interchange protein DsbD [Roseimaritima multifibrata]|uniref:Thiol:disulfide interchange protein DsbD n=1 Tax=Roseimaritima multifibrata TaxID=1930274 RepID=A0A517MBW3_9BACT|nr:thioredoxin family protein [Roseimaritima multifibrata]QDS92355.1 Thiol:disulfide interchange protein DsbD [Roseimaritima multifibrata]
MVSLFLAAVLATVVSDQPVTQQNYAQAYQSAHDEGKPLVVVVGAEWCPACVTLKEQTIAQMKAEGEFSEVSMAIVDQDAEPALAAQLKRGQSIPQIIVFSPQTSGGWKRTQMTGFQTRATIRTVLKRAKQRILGS